MTVCFPDKLLWSKSFAIKGAFNFTFCIIAFSLFLHFILLLKCVTMSHYNEPHNIPIMSSLSINPSR